MAADDEPPVLTVLEGIEFTADGQFLIDGNEVSPGRYRLQASDGPAMLVLTVEDPNEDGM
ncbi:hypothetical protein AB0F17_34640 [Nonomuraea sp. NPDC026600]|uniref:hypothetical protein n=1 Tax=Nonomuraea sp. NPDC026600 TaxID=3155363 RepID=UPI0033EF027E